MPISALTHGAADDLVVPTGDEEWDVWVSASATRNHVLDDPLLDWLGRHGEAHGFQRDDGATLDERTDFRTFIFRKGAEFERAVVDHLSTLPDVHTVERAEGGYAARRDLGVAEAMFDVMQRGEPITYQGVVRDAETRTFGSPDLLVRSDVLAQLFPGSITQEAAAVSADDLGDPGWHYLVVDSKFATLGLAAGGGARKQRRGSGEVRRRIATGVHARDRVERPARDRRLRHGVRASRHPASRPALTSVEVGSEGAAAVGREARSQASVL